MVNKSVLFLGSGMMARACLAKLMTHPHLSLHIASNIPADAQLLAQLYPGRATSSEVNVLDQSSLGPKVQECDLVISYIPAFLHIHVARQCLKHKKHLVTASYTNKELQQLNAEAKQAGLTFLMQLGLDPGIDHLSAMMLIDKFKDEGFKIEQFQSFCGALPSPEFIDNPIGYKFTWSPIGALRAANNPAVFYRQDQVVETAHQDLLYLTDQIQINCALTLEGYSNRDSLKYKQLYGLQEAHYIRRGTLRYPGFCTVINAFKALGIYNEDKVQPLSWRQFIASKLSKEKVDLPKSCQKLVQGKDPLMAPLLAVTVFSNERLAGVSQQQKLRKAKKISECVSCFKLLGEDKLDPTLSSLQNLTKKLQPYLKIEQQQSDLIAMQHIFKISKGPLRKTVRSTLLIIGQKGGLTAVSKTVGFPTAIGAHLLLQGRVKQRGVVIPLRREWYEPIMQELGREGVRMREQQQD